MIELRKVDSSSVPLATAGRVVLFAGTDGVMRAKKEDGTVILAQGPKGEKGDAGTPGTNGTNGVKGDKGDAGTPGTNGTNGTSAFVLGANLNASVAISTITDALVFRLLVAANTLAVNDLARIRALARFTSTAVASAQTRRIRVTKVVGGSQTVVGAVDYGNAATARSNQPCNLDAVVRVVAIGASGSVVFMGQEGRPTANNATPVNAANATAIDTTVDNWLELWDVTNNTAAITTWEAGRIEVVR